MLLHLLKKCMVGVAARVFEGLEFLRLGVATNWFGLACPAHCSPSSFAPIALAFLSGSLLGFLACLILGFWLFRALLPPPQTILRPPCFPRGQLDRLRGYLHE